MASCFLLYYFSVKEILEKNEKCLNKKGVK